MAEEIVSYQRQAPFIEDRIEKLLASVFGTGKGPIGGQPRVQPLPGPVGFPGTIRTADFRDSNNDGVDDRDQTIMEGTVGPALPPQGKPVQPGFPSRPEGVGLAEIPTEIPAYEVAGLSPQQLQAMQLAQTGLGAYQPSLEAARTTVGTGLETLGAAQQVLDPSQISTYMDPYQQQVTQEALAEFQRQADIQAQRTAAEGVAAGAFGGGRFGVREAEEARNLAQVKSQRIFEDLSRNYLQAQQAQRQTAQQLGTLGSQTLQAAQAQAGLGQLGQQLSGEDINRLLGIGGMQQQFGYVGPEGTFVPGQAQIEAARATTLAEQKEPFERTAFASDILRGVPSSQISYTQVPSPSIFQQIAGLGIAGLGAYGAATGGLGGITSLSGL